MRKRITASKTPVRYLIEGLLAGAVGAGAQTLFFRATQKLKPQTPSVFEGVEPEQRNEKPTETVGRRFVEQLAKRGPLSERQKVIISTLIHYGFGAAWAAMFNLVRGSYPRLRSARSLIGFSLVVWAIGDNLFLPLFKLATWPQRYPPKTHVYAAAAHLAYGGGVGGALAAEDFLNAVCNSRMTHRMR
jgi:hypothetical protein